MQAAHIPGKGCGTVVQSSRKASGPGPIRALNLPVPLAVEEDTHQNPLALTLRGRRLPVSSIDDLWEIGDQWWREEAVSRKYYQVAIEDGRLITIFRDLISGEWYRQRG